MDTPNTIDGNNPSAAIKDDDAKARMDLLPVGPLMRVAEVYTYGAKKYTPNNWRKGMRWGRVYAALMRHLFRFWSGEDVDPESGLPHLAHAAFGILTLLDYSQTRPEMDDRPVAGAKI